MREDLKRMYPTMAMPVRCENGCGAVFELASGYLSYKKNNRGEPLLFCECCAAEEGHRDEDLEQPEDTPVCRRKQKKQL